MSEPVFRPIGTGPSTSQDSCGSSLRATAHFRGLCPLPQHQSAPNLAWVGALPMVFFLFHPCYAWSFQPGSQIPGWLGSFLTSFMSSPFISILKTCYEPSAECGAGAEWVPDREGTRSGTLRVQAIPFRDARYRRSSRLSPGGNHGTAG